MVNFFLSGGYFDAAVAQICQILPEIAKKLVRDKAIELDILTKNSGFDYSRIIGNDPVHQTYMTEISLNYGFAERFFFMTFAVFQHHF